MDSKGRIVLPQEIRERLGITPGTEVEICEEDGKVVIEPETDPERIIERGENLIEQPSSGGGRRRRSTTKLIRLRGNIELLFELERRNTAMSDVGGP